MGSAGHLGCVTRRGVRRDSAQWAGLISTRERAFCGGSRVLTEFMSRLSVVREGVSWVAGLDRREVF